MIDIDFDKLDDYNKQIYYALEDINEILEETDVFIEQYYFLPSIENEKIEGKINTSIKDYYDNLKIIYKEMEMYYNENYYNMLIIKEFTNGEKGLTEEKYKDKMCCVLFSYMLDLKFRIIDINKTLVEYMRIINILLFQSIDILNKEINFDID